METNRFTYTNINEATRNTGMCGVEPAIGLKTAIGILIAAVALAVSGILSL